MIHPEDWQKFRNPSHTLLFLLGASGPSVAEKALAGIVGEMAFPWCSR